MSKNKTRVEYSGGSGEKKKVRLMDAGKGASKNEAGKAAGGGGGGKKGEDLAQQSLNDDTEPPTVKSNFFDFQEDADTDVWGPRFTRTLRKASQSFESMPFIPDPTVEKIGGAFVDEDRSLKPLYGRMEVDSPNPPFTSLSSASMAELDRVKELERRVEELEIACWKAPPIDATINRLLLGKTCSLSWYKSIEAKKELLNQAIATLDGNCIMAVLLFIKKSVDQSILLNILEHYPIAAQHYANFLRKLKDWKSLRALYRRLNAYDDLAYFCLQECAASGLDKEERIRRIKSCVIQFNALPKLEHAEDVQHHQHHQHHAEDVQHVEEYSRLSNKQLKIEEAAGHGADVVLREGSVLFQPLTTTLLYCLRHHRGHERSTGNPEELRKLFNVPERQYFQMELLALALRRDWSAIGAMLTSKGVLGFGKKKKSPIGFERVVRLLGQERYRAPEIVLRQYLEEVDDLDLRYQLAMEVGMYDLALETLRTLKDGERVRAFINYLPPVKHPEFRRKVDQLLSNSQIKWKT